MLAKQFKFCTIPTLQMGTQVWREAVCQAHRQGQQHSPKELQLPEQLAHVGGVGQQCPPSLLTPTVLNPLLLGKDYMILHLGKGSQENA